MKKLVNIITGNAIGFIVGALVFGWVLGAVAAVSISANDIAYTTNKNANVATVKDAVDDLYLKTRLLDYSKVTGSGITYKYSQDSDISAYNEEPNENVSTTNSSYSNGDTYLRTTYINNVVTGHAACLKYNDREFCMEPNYWACPLNTSSTDCGLKTQAKLQAAMEAALGTSADSCGLSDVHCTFDSVDCIANYDGSVTCWGDSGNAYVASDGSAGFI